MRWLSKVAELHDDYIRIVQSFGEEFYAEDIVQEMYIRLTQYYKPFKIVNEQGQINKSYIYLVLRAIVCDLHTEKRKHQKVPLEHIKNMGVEYEYISKGEAEYSLEIKLRNEMKSWEWFDRDLFKVYRDSGMSMRQIAAETNISTKTIFYSIKKSKEKLKENIAEDYEDYINGDYELL
mgnify:CR=1 FL=1|tara:strand:+ start:375 stop:908 length:534 start_codon:yes stop_codon:yes gene_type:complete